MDPIKPTIPKIAYGAQDLKRIYYDETLIWPVPTGIVVPGHSSFIELWELTGSGAMMTMLANIIRGGTPFDTGLPATAHSALIQGGSGDPVQEGTVIIVATMTKGNLAFGTNLPCFAAHNGTWWCITPYRDSLIMQDLPWASSRPGANFFKGFYISRAYNGGMTKAQLVAQIPNNTVAYYVDVDAHIISFVGNSAVHASFTKSANRLTMTYVLPPGMTDNDLIWPSAPGAEPLGPKV